MENNQLNLNKIYEELQDLKNILVVKGILSNQTPSDENEPIWDWSKKINVLADEKLLSEDWLSPEDEETWKSL